MPPATTDAARAAERPSAIVGVGASAGGVAALTAMFAAAAPGSGLAYVVLLHLGRHHDSVLVELIGRACALPVVAGADGQALLPDRVHVVPPGTVAIVANGRLVLPPGDPYRRERQPIDILFSSLAEDAAERAVGVVLSGSGADGTLGVRAIKEAGGLTVVQGDDGGALTHRSMPESAAANGMVDLVLPVAAIPARIADYARSLAIVAPLAERADARAEEARLSICAVLLQETGHDFAGYKARAFIRRVARRMQVLRIEKMEAYARQVANEPEEARALFRDLLIGVTMFFRDTEVFDVLAQSVVPQLFAGKGAQDTVRVWVPGCSTGEEAYSIAMLLLEHAATLHAPPRIQVFATDIDEPVLAVARTGRYPLAHVGGIAPERLARFMPRDGPVHVASKALREACVFSTHSLVRDPPFSRLDLVSCRNLLIYIGNALQREIVPLFHFALRPGGFLLLGSAESAASYTDLFQPIDAKRRVYQRRDHAFVAPRLNLAGLARRGGAPTGPPAETSPAVALRRLADAAVAERHAPAHVVVDRHGEVLHVSARTGRFLELAPGHPTRSVLALARRGLRLELRAVLDRAARDRQRATRGGIQFEGDGKPGRATLSAEPLPGTSAGDPLFLVVFVEEPGPAWLAPEPQAEDDAAAHARLEVHEVRERLDAVTEDYEAAMAELRAGNEELVSLNEELQSANQELETAKEEQEASNEELLTVNQELHRKVDELDSVASDLRNLFNASGIATVILDRTLSVRSYTPAAEALFGLIPTDAGRPLAQLSGTLATPDLDADARATMADGRVRERRVSSRDGRRHYLLRVAPYLASDGTVQGALAAFVEVTELVEAVEAREHQRVLVAELNHRVRNVLQVAIALIGHTVREGGSIADVAAILTGRMRALSKAYQLVARDQWGDVELEDLVRAQLEPHLAGPSAGAIGGPPVSLGPGTAVALGLVLHELATNAVKYGALSVEGGHVSVAWSIEAPPPAGGPRSLVLRWSETGGPAVVSPSRRGSGSALITRQVRHALKGTLDVVFAAGGFGAVIVFPLVGDEALVEDGADAAVAS